MNQIDDKSEIPDRKRIGAYVKIAQIVVILTLPFMVIFPKLFKYIIILSSLPWAIGIFFLLRLGLQYISYKLRQKRTTNVTSRDGGA